MFETIIGCSVEITSMETLKGLLWSSWGKTVGGGVTAGHAQVLDVGSTRHMAGGRRNRIMDDYRILFRTFRRVLLPFTEVERQKRSRFGVVQKFILDQLILRRY